MFSSAEHPLAEHPLAQAFNLLFHRPDAPASGARAALRPGTLRRRQAEAAARIRTRLLGLARRLCARLREPEEAVHEAVARLAHRPRPAMDSDGQTVGYLGRVLRSVLVGRVRSVSLDGGGLIEAAARRAPTHRHPTGPRAGRDPAEPGPPADPHRCLEALPAPGADPLGHLEGRRLTAAVEALTEVAHVASLLPRFVPPTALRGVAVGVAERAQRLLQGQGLRPGTTPEAPGQTARGKRERRAIAALDLLLPQLDAHPECAALAALVRAPRI